MNRMLEAAESSSGARGWAVDKSKIYRLMGLAVLCVSVLWPDRGIVEYIFPLIVDSAIRNFKTALSVPLVRRKNIVVLNEPINESALFAYFDSLQVAFPNDPIGALVDRPRYKDRGRGLAGRHFKNRHVFGRINDSAFGEKLAIFRGSLAPVSPEKREYGEVLPRPIEGSSYIVRGDRGSLSGQPSSHGHLVCLDKSCSCFGACLGSTGYSLRVFDTSLHHLKLPSKHGQLTASDNEESESEESDETIDDIGPYLGRLGALFAGGLIALYLWYRGSGNWISGRRAQGAVLCSLACVLYWLGVAAWIGWI